MKASALIQHLQKIVEEKGDLDVYVEDLDGGPLIRLDDSPTQEPGWTYTHDGSGGIKGPLFIVVSGWRSA
jgi:hypothetical protein